MQRVGGAERPILFDAIVAPGRHRWYRHLAGLSRHVVSGTDPEFHGQPIVGEGLDLLVDLSRRFAHAHRKIDELPHLVEWDEVVEAVEAIRWDAARHAASLSRSETRWADVRHARPGSPQAALRARLEIERADEVEILRRYQRVADRLMNRAADAAAAAVVASELGFDLDVALPSAAARAATRRLDDVIARLDTLTEAWKALDVSTELAAEELRAEEAERAVEARVRAARLTERLGRATGAHDDPGSAHDTVDPMD